jgi:hypothetical protein
MDEPKRKGMKPDGVAPTASGVNVILPIHLTDAEDDRDENAESTPTMFARSYWLLPRVPCIGEHILVEAIRRRVRVESVWWDAEGHAVVNLQPFHAPPGVIELLEDDGWSVAPWEDEPPSDWLN